MLKTIPNNNLCYTVTRRVNYIKALSFHILGIHEILKYEELKRTIWIWVRLQWLWPCHKLI